MRLGQGLTRLVGLAVATVATAVMAAAPAYPDPGSTIPGPEIERLLRANLQPSPGSAADPSQIRCPATREYRDGDVARCSMPVGNGTVEVLLVTLFREGDSWRFTIGIE